MKGFVNVKASCASSGTACRILTLSACLAQFVIFHDIRNKSKSTRVMLQNIALRYYGWKSRVIR